MMRLARARKHFFLRTLQLSIGLLLLVFITVSPLIAGGSNDVKSMVSLDDSPSVEVSSEYLEITGEFYENQGQISDSSIHFYAEVDGGHIGLGTNRIALWSGSSPPNDIIVFDESICLEPIGQDRTGHIANYYLGSRGTYTNVQSYRSVLYQEVLPGIDMMFDDPSKGIICQVFSDDESDFAAVSKMFKATDMFDWIKEESNASESLMRFSLRNRTDGEFLTSQDDEVLLSRCMRGSNRDEALAIARDTAGNLYITGRTASQDFPVVNAMNSSLNGGDDVFVTKIDSNGTIAYSTFIGGGQGYVGAYPTQPNDVGNDITVDSAGNVYLTGNTKSNDFPTTANSLYSYPENESILRGEYREDQGDAFVLKLDSSMQLEYSTYFGGKSGDIAYSISLDADGNMYIGGRTASRVFPTVNAIDDDHSTGIYDGFVACISAAGDTLLFSTFFGGSQEEEVRDLAIDDSGNVVVTGNTGGGLSLISPLQSTFGGGNLDAFVLKIDSGWNVVYSTYLGGSNSDLGYSICVDSIGTAYVTGRTESPNFHNVSPLTGNYGGSGDCYITAISYDGAGIDFSSFVGGGGADTGYCIDVDAAGRITVAGETYSQDFPGASGENSGGADGFIFKTNRTVVLYSTYIGGAENDEIRSMVVGSENDTFVCGITRSTDFPFAESPTDTTGFDAFVYAIRTSNPDVTPPPPLPPPLIWGVMIAASGIGLVAIRTLFLNVRTMRRREYEVAMRTTGGPHDEILLGPPTDYSEDMLYPERPVPQWNQPTDHPDGGIDPEKPVPQWNQPTDHPDGGIDPERPVPQWN
ncbi:MAG: SBBP repeat-containing protein, partial [Candidatus Thorarchaeota archaeon]